MGVKSGWRQNVQKVADICEWFKTFPKCLQCYNHEKKTGLDKNNTQQKTPTAGFTREVKKHIKCYVQNQYMKGERSKELKKVKKKNQQTV